MRFSLLGSLEARVDGEALPLGGAKQRSLLALLLLRANEPLSRERLIDGVWGAERPSTVGAALNVHLSKIRKLLAGTHATLVTELHGYVLRIDPERLDVHRFERLVREGRQALVAGRPEEAAAILDRALAVWRGPPLAELELDASVDAALGRLGELRLSALEDRFEAGLLLGRHTELVAEIEEFVREHPRRERATAQLMISLYRSGRQSEALRAYRDVRQLLAEELGLDPGPELQRLEKAILVQDPSLIPSERRRLRTGRAGRLAAVIALALISGALLALERGGPGTQAPEPVASVTLARARDVAVIQPDTKKVVARVPVGSSPALLREGDGSVWVADPVDLTVTEIDLESRRVLRTVGTGFRPDDLAAQNDTLWAFDKEERVLARLGEEQTWDRFEHPGFTEIERMALDDHAVWLAGGARLIRVDPDSGRVVRNAFLPVSVDGLATAGNELWAVSNSAAAVLRIDPDTAEIRDRIDMSGEAGPRTLSISADADFIWVLDGHAATVVKIDRVLQDIVETYRLGVGRGALALAAGEGAAWISNAFDGTVTRIDGGTDEVASIAISAYSSPKDVTVAGGLVWVSVAAGRGSP